MGGEASRLFTLLACLIDVKPGPPNDHDCFYLPTIPFIQPNSTGPYSPPPQAPKPPGPPQSCSFSADRLVETRDGGRPIGSPKAGDAVRAWNQASNSVGDYPVSAVLIHVDPVVEDLTVNGETLETTPEHPFYTEENGWLPAASLWAGAHIYRADGSWGTVKGLREEHRPEAMYNLTVQTAHTLFVGDQQLLVHNDCGQRPVPFQECIGPQDVPTIAPYIEQRPGGFGNWRANPASMDDIGRAWVGPGFRVSRDGRVWVSVDGLRIYRLPRSKRDRPTAPANLVYNGVAPQANAHINVDPACP